MKSDPTGGVKCFSIAGRMIEERLRCMGMTDEERRWRAQWLKDQVLSPEEPREVPEYYKKTNNFIRRLWKTPFNKFEKFLVPKIGEEAAFQVRHFVGKSIVGLLCVYLITYYIKYHSNDFTVSRGLTFIKFRGIMYPDDPNYPNYPVKKPSDYYDQGFYSSVLCQDVPPIPPPPTPPPPAPPKDESGVVCPISEGNS